MSVFLLTFLFLPLKWQKMWFLDKKKNMVGMGFALTHEYRKNVISWQDLYLWHTFRYWVIYYSFLIILLEYSILGLFFMHTSGALCQSNLSFTFFFFYYISPVVFNDKPKVIYYQDGVWLTVWMLEAGSCFTEYSKLC